jgi:hypothetical protein
LSIYNSLITGNNEQIAFPDIVILAEKPSARAWAGTKCQKALSSTIEIARMAKTEVTHIRRDSIMDLLEETLAPIMRIWG